ncbi:MAG: 2-dehydropantoate 2-reductase [Chloroflexi bacterium]|nr:2-dehydropantoate 2-reductase [Chloroflexota bacterium]MYF21509.1 2-dehydropantoate 2-reductase [Chloroflexota bacterium]
MHPQPQRVAVVGAGAIGCYFGMRLAEVGHDVRFLMRRDYDAVTSGGLNLTSHLGDLSLDAPTIERTPEALAAHGPVDWVLVGLKATAIPDIPKLLGPLLSADTRVLAIMNGLTVDDEIAAQLPEGTSLFGGLGFIGVSRGEPGRIVHMEFGAINLGHHGDDPDELQRGVVLFAGSKVEIRPEASLLKARWEKLCWNIPFNGLCVIAGGVGVDQVITEPPLYDAAYELIMEIVAAGNADLEARGESVRIDGGRIAHLFLTQTLGMGAYRPSTVIDYNEGRPLELDAIFRQPVQRASELGVPCPMMSMVATLVGKLGSTGPA